MSQMASTPLPDVPGLVGDLRSDHAGETGAVMIYRGILSASRDPGVREFAERHRATEQRHLELLEGILPLQKRSLLLPLWKIAGFLTGWLPAIAGPNAVYATIEAVETFVDKHYAEQIAKLSSVGDEGVLRRVLEECQSEEVHHRDEAAARQNGTRPAMLLRGWAWVVGKGSAAAVAAARRL